ncbi:GTPase family protein [Nitrincola iocasae]|uniref:GTPase family protein n=1 Tax=Nitrincola iocasae TaxID=2614693 RepID=UPI001786CC7A|nr:GTPase [Nitrincola iocasae]
MKRLLNSYRISHKLFTNLIPLLLILIAFPLLLLAGFGLIALYQFGYLLHFVVLLSLLSLVFALVVRVGRKSITKQSTNNLPPDEALVVANTDWSDFDLQVWQQLNTQMDSLMDKNDQWEVLREHALALISATASAYRAGKTGGELAFTLPELLSMTEEISRRYYLIVMEHLPFAEQLKLSTVKRLYSHRDKADKVQKIWAVYRAYRLFTPTGLISEARSQLAGYMLDDVQAEVSYKLKKAFLQEVVSVAIDLYSGRFRIKGALNSSAAQASDRQNRVSQPDPLRICLIGQLKSGKSSVINALTQESNAEVDHLPATDSVQVHQLKAEGVPLIHLVDLPGLDGNPKTEKRLLEQASQADLLLWVLKANQPARALDVNFKAKLDTFYQQPDKLSRKRPAIIALVNQVDRLAPLSEWSPPYDLDDSTTAKADSIRDALAYNQSLLQPDHLLPLSLAPDKPHYNLTSLLQLLDQHYDQALQTQLNRRRLEMGMEFSTTEQFRRVYHLGKSLFRAVKGSEKTDHRPRNNQ